MPYVGVSHYLLKLILGRKLIFTEGDEFNAVLISVDPAAEDAQRIFVSLQATWEAS